MTQAIILTGSVPNLGQTMRYVGAYRIATEIENAGYSTVVLDYIQKFSYEEIIQFLSKHISNETLMVGISSTFFMPDGDAKNLDDRRLKTSVEQYYPLPYETIKKIFNYIREKSNARIVYGGSLSHSMIDPNVDYYVHGYGDMVVKNLMNHLANKKQFPPKKISGKFSYDWVDYEQPNMNYINTDWHLPQFNVMNGECVSIEVGRGCMFKCSYCNLLISGKRKGTYWRNFDSLKNEMVSIWEKTGTTHFNISDETFNDDPDKVEYIMKLFQSLPFQPRFAAYLRLDLIDRYPDTAQMLLDGGLLGCFFGIETFNHASGKSIGKGMPPDKTLKRLEILKKQFEGKANIAIGQLLGLPHDDETYFKQITKMIEDNIIPVDSIYFNAVRIIKAKSKYNSSFGNDPEKYGYELEQGTFEWKNQHTTYRECKDLERHLQTILTDRNKPDSFFMMDLHNIGISDSEMLTQTRKSLYMKYDVKNLEEEFFNRYKKIISGV